MWALAPTACDVIPRMPRHRWAGLIATLALAATSCTTPDTTAIDRLHECTIDEGPAGAYCGTLDVFEDRVARQGRRVPLKIVVAPALRRDPAPDPLFVLAGGPGQPAASMAGDFLPAFRRFRTDRDVVFVDQRGTGASNRLGCDPSLEELDEVAVDDDRTLARYRACLAALDADPRLYTTPIAMDDLDDVRAFLGYDRINLWGGSYGTRAALVYLRRHEAHVRSLILDGVAPPDMLLPLHTARDAQRAFDRLLADCAADAGCGTSFPTLQTDAAALFARLEREPPVVTAVHPRTGKPFEQPLTRRDVALVVFRALYSPEVTSLLPRVLTQAAAGRYDGLLALAFQGAPEGDARDMALGMHLSIVCAEDILRITAEAKAEAAASGFLGAAMFEAQYAACDFWPVGPVPDDYYAPVTSGHPVLIFSGADDPVTPPVWGERVAAQLANARHIVVPGAGHSTLTRGCVPTLIQTFLTEASAASLDPSCLQTLGRPPFFVTPTGPAMTPPARPATGSTPAPRP
jgi:pimeloyl-ACP methyl ester carboxylesterase